MSKREISWESCHIDSDLEEENIEDIYNDGFQETEELPTLTNTPWGLFKIDDKMNPYRQFEFWTGHTNFNIDEEAKYILDNTLGVEVLFILTPLRFMVAKGKMFEWTDVRVAIERGLCGKHAIDEKIESIQDPETFETISKLKEDLVKAFDHWAIYVFPNGKYDYSYIKDESVEEFEKFMKSVEVYQKSEQLSGGILLQSGVMNE